MPYLIMNPANLYERNKLMMDIDTGEVISVKKIKVINNDDGSCTSTLRKLKKIVLVIPQRIEQILQGLNEQYKDVEFSICTKTLYDETTDTFYMDSGDVFIPKQRVSRAFIEYEEDNLEYNTVIHRHPDGCTSFSGTDDQYINSNFKFSILWVNKSFSKAIMNVLIEPGVLAEVPIDIKIPKMKPIYLPEAAHKIKNTTGIDEEIQKRVSNFGQNYVEYDDLYRSVIIDNVKKRISDGFLGKKESSLDESRNDFLDSITEHNDRYNNNVTKVRNVNFPCKYFK